MPDAAACSRPAVRLLVHLWTEWCAGALHRGQHKVSPMTATVSQRERLKRLDADRRERFKILDRMREAFKDVSPEEIEREVNRACAEVKRENIARRSANSS